MVMYSGQRGEIEYHGREEIGQDDGQSIVELRKVHPCPYRDRCPGFEDAKECLGGDDWIPQEGFIVLPGEILCLDWDIVIPGEPNGA